jgi:phage regulator Rha-like protein
MTSREIAELTGKQHKDVLYDIRNMLEALKKDQLSFERIYKDAKGRTYQEFRLDRDEDFTLHKFVDGAVLRAPRTLN